MNANLFGPPPSLIPGVQPRRIQLTTLSISKPPISGASPANKTVPTVTAPKATTTQMPMTTDTQSNGKLPPGGNGMAEPVLDNREVKETVYTPDRDSPMKGVTETACASPDQVEIMQTI